MTLETLNSLFPIYRRLPKLNVNPLVWSGRIGTDKRACVRRSFGRHSYNHELPPAPSASPATNYVGPSVSCIPAVLSRCQGVQNGNSGPSSSNPHHNGSRPTLASPTPASTSVRRCQQHIPVAMPTHRSLSDVGSPSVRVTDDSPGAVTFR